MEEGRVPREYVKVGNYLLICDCKRIYQLTSGDIFQRGRRYKWLLIENGILWLIARLAPTVHVHMLKHGGIASKGHCIAFPQAVQEPATILPGVPAEVDIIRVRRQGRDDTHKDFRVRRYRVQEALCWLKDNNPAYSDICCPHTQSTRR